MPGAVIALFTAGKVLVYWVSWSLLSLLPLTVIRSMLAAAGSWPADRLTKSMRTGLAVFRPSMLPSAFRMSWIAIAELAGSRPAVAAGGVHELLCRQCAARRSAW